MKRFSADLRSGLVVSLIALPLSMGIAMASGAPPAAGLLSAIVGGMLGALIGGSELTINGAAAGLIVVVLQGVHSLGQGDSQMGFQMLLGCCVLAGALQILLGLLRLGGLVLAVPSSVIQGMLAGIGVIIMLKQLPVLLGVTPQSHEMLGLIRELPSLLESLNPLITAIGVSSLAVFVFWPKLSPKGLRPLPSALVAVVWAMGLSLYFQLSHDHSLTFLSWDVPVGPSNLLSVPANLRQALTLPDFSQVFTLTGLRVALTLALVASIESLLSAYAVDRMDPLKRKSNFRLELVSKGVCNMILGLIGGLPIIAEIVRSRANVDSHAQSRWSNFFHGLFILVFLVAIPGVLQHIPLSALAAMLIVVGFRLARPGQLVHAWRLGWDQTLVFGTTLLLTVFVDLLVAVVAGMFLELVLNALRSGDPLGMFHVGSAWRPQGSVAHATLTQPLGFTNVIPLRRQLERLKQDVDTRELKLDLQAVPFVDHTVMEMLHHAQDEFGSNGKSLKFMLSDRHVATGQDPLSARVLGDNAAA